MALFQKKTQMQKTEVELAALTSRVTLLKTKRSAAQAVLDTAVQARQKMLLTGDIEDIRASLALQAKVDTAISALAGFDTAITAQAALITDAEAKLAAERLDADRKAASQLLAAQVAAVDELLGPWLRTSRNLASALEAIHWRFESTQMGAFVRNAAGEIENAAAMTADDLQHSIKAIRDGGQGIPSAPSATVVPPAVTVAEPVAATPASPARFHRVDRPSYQVRVTGANQ